MTILAGNDNRAIKSGRGHCSNKTNFCLKEKCPRWKKDFHWDFQKLKLAAKENKYFLVIILFSAWNEFARAFLFKGLWLLSRIHRTNHFFTHSGKQ